MLLICLITIGSVDSNNGFENYANYWKNSLFKIQKRLGGIRYKELLKCSQQCDSKASEVE